MKSFQKANNLEKDQQNQQNQQNQQKHAAGHKFTR